MRHERREERKILRELDEIEHLLESNHFTVFVYQETSMAIGNLTAGGTGTFAAVLLANGTATSLPTGALFVWSSTDSSAVLTPSADTTSTVVAIPAGDTSANVTITATVDVGGTVVAGSITVPVSGVAQVFTVSVTQTA